MASRRPLLVGVLVVAVAAVLPVVTSAVRALLSPARRLDGAKAALPLAFVENRGQLPRGVSYAVSGSKTSLYFSPGGMSFDLVDQGAGTHVAVDFVGARQVAPAAEHRLPGTVGLLGGADAGLPAYAGVAYRDLWPGIDLHYAGAGGRLKYRFIVHPGADPGAVRLAYRGATGLSIEPGGALAVHTAVRDVVDEAPSTYQATDRGRAPVPSSFALDAARSAVSFRVGAYDHGRDLVVDPAVVVSPGLLDGSGAVAP